MEGGKIKAGEKVGGSKRLFQLMCAESELGMSSKSKDDEFGSLIKMIKGVNNRVDNLEVKLDGKKEGNVSLSQQIDYLNDRLDGLEVGDDFGDKEMLLQLIKEVNSRVDKLEDKLDKVEEKFQNEIGRLESLVLDTRHEVEAIIVDQTSRSSEKVGCNRIFVGGLPFSVTDRIFYDYFVKFGEISNAKVMVDKATDCSRGFGFVTYQSQVSVERVLCHPTNHEIHGCFVEVKQAHARNPKDLAQCRVGGSSSANADGRGGQPQSFSRDTSYGYGPPSYVLTPSGWVHPWLPGDVGRGGQGTYGYGGGGGSGAYGYGGGATGYM